MKTYLAFSAIVLAGLLALNGCETDPINASSIENNDGYSQIIDGTTLEKFAFEEISDVEAQSLVFMREEEKLARDVYAYFYTKYNLPVFKNINKSETAHTTAIKYLLDKYGIPDPLVNDIPGTFNNSDLQELYDQLIEQGNVSNIEALKVGAIIEEVDILDLMERYELVDNADIKFVFTNLTNGSKNHLRAFVGNLSFRGVTYSPQYLSLDLYNSIINK